MKACLVLKRVINLFEELDHWLKEKKENLPDIYVAGKSLV